MRIAAYDVSGTVFIPARYTEIEFRTGTGTIIVITPPPATTVDSAATLTLTAGRYVRLSKVASDYQIVSTGLIGYPPSQIHNQLELIQGGSASERYHLTAEQVADLAATASALEPFDITETSGVPDTTYNLADYGLPDGFEPYFGVLAQTPLISPPHADKQWTFSSGMLEFLTGVETGQQAQFFIRKTA